MRIKKNKKVLYKKNNIKCNHIKKYRGEIVLTIEGRNFTIKELEDITGIANNTLRRWRKNGILYMLFKTVDDVYNERLYRYNKS